MKTLGLLPLLLELLLICPNLFSQEDESYFTIGGIIKNAKTKTEIEQVNVSASGTAIGTISNKNGEFTLKIKKTLDVDEIELSCVGYYNAKFKITGNDLLNQTYLLTPQFINLKEIEVITWKNPQELIEAAIANIPKNYSVKNNLLTGFYRETVQKRKNYIDLSEAVVHIYKTAYTQDMNRDRVQVLKGRRLISPQKKDTLAVKLLGGPNLVILLDIIKNPDVLLDKEYLHLYRYTMGEPVIINEKLQYTVRFDPAVDIANEPLYSGVFYIDRDNLSFTRAEFKMNMRDKDKVRQRILRQKPRDVVFTPEDVIYVVSYKPYQDKYYLNYIRTEIKFKCDSRRRLFATNYTVTGEMVITDNQKENVSPIPAKTAFSIHKSLGDEVMSYYDSNFWGAYNIIEPTESLESAVLRLKRKDF